MESISSLEVTKPLEESIREKDFEKLIVSITINKKQRQFQQDSY